MPSIGERIKSARLSKGLSQTELAHAAAVSQPTVANWENDSHAPRQLALERLAGILNTTAQFFLNGSAYDARYVQAPGEYLDTPIRHVPIIKWPRLDEIVKGRVHVPPGMDYIAVCTGAARPFGLIANDPNMTAQFPIGTTIIFDSAPGELEPGALYLFKRGGAVVLRRWQNSPDRLEALPNHTAVDAEFTTNRPIPLARARRSVQRH